MKLKNDSLWNQALKIVQKNVNEKAYETWFVLTDASFNEEGVLEIGSPNSFSCDWLKENYSGLISDALKEVAGNTVAFQIKVQNKTPTIVVDEKQKESAISSLKKVTPIDKNNLNPKYTFDEFVVGSNNRFAHAAALAVAEQPAKEYNPLFIYGGVGLGKTHLMNAIGHKILDKHPESKILYITSEKFTNQLIRAIQTRTTAKFREIYRHVDVLLIDDIQFIAGKESTQEEFFHTFNALYDFHKQIIVSSDKSPKEIKSLEERLISRFEWGLVTDIQPPDYETRIAILQKKCESFSIQISQEVIEYISENIKTNIRELEGALVRVAAHAKLIGDEISISTVQRVLKDILQEENKKITIELIQEKVSHYFHIKISDLKAKKRTKNIAYPRQVAMHLSRKLTNYSLPEIGDYFGGRDHTTVMHSVEKIDKGLMSDKMVQNDYDMIMKNL